MPSIGIMQGVSKTDKKKKEKRKKNLNSSAPEIKRPSIRWELATQKNLQITNTSESNVNVLHTKPAEVRNWQMPQW